MPMSFQVTVDCREPHTLADWWARTLGWEVEPQDATFIASMVEQGHASEADTTTHRGALVWRDGAAIVHPGPAPVPGGRVYFQKVPEGKTVKNRVHLDLRPGPGESSPSVEALVARGATVVGEGRQGPHTWTVLTDPEGNEFCVS